MDLARGQGAVEVVLRPAQTHGKTEIGWIGIRHTFSFGDYDDPAAMWFSAQRAMLRGVSNILKGCRQVPLSIWNAWATGKCLAIELP
jgi:hypothetical protein